MKIKRFLSLFVMVFLVAALAACGSDSSGGSSGSDNDSNGDSNGGENDNDKDSGKQLVVATDNSFVPFEFVDKDSGGDEVQGFDIDLMKAVADEADLNIKFKTMDFKGIIPGLKSGRWDMGIAGISITDKRKKAIDFSDPYFKSGIIVAVQEDNTDIKGFDDLAGKTVSTRQGSTSQDYLKEKSPKSEVKAYPKITQGYQELAAGRVDATLYDAPNLKYYIKQSAKGKIKTVGDKLTAEPYAIAFQKDSDLADKVNKALKTIKDDGTYDDIYKEWFGENPED